MFLPGRRALPLRSPAWLAGMRRWASSNAAMMDKTCRQAAISAKGKISPFAGEFFTAPLSFIILVVRAITIVSQTQW